MKKTLNFLFVILFIIVIAYLFAPDKEYTRKLWVHKGMALAQPYQAAVIEYARKTNALPRPGDLEYEKIQVKVDLENVPVKSITVGEEGPGTVTIHYFTTDIDPTPSSIDNRKIILVPTLSSNKLSWSCSGTVPDELMPPSCK